ncbi:MAG: MFS transporter [Proteobacteria bacterium]|nr:MAG: MFS transporter [Pseudomonadota bacterium]
MTRLHYAVLTVSVCGSFLPPFMTSSVNIALPAIQETYRHQGIDAVLLSWVATIYLLAAGVSLVPMGRLADIRGRKRILGYGFALFGLCSLCCCLAPHISTLLFFRFLQGVGGGMIFSTGIAILTSVFPPDKRGRVLGIAVATVYIGLLTGPFIGGLLVHCCGWRTLFLMIGLSCLIPWGLVLLFLDGEWMDAAGERYDVIGVAVYVPSLVGIIYGFSILPEIIGVLCLAAGSGGLVIFIVRQYRSSSPLFQVKLFVDNRVFALSCLAALIHYSATFALMFLLSLLLQYILGFEPAAAGMVLMAQPVMMALFSPLAGRYSDRFEPRVLSSAGLMITGGCLLALCFVDGSTSVFSLVTILSVLGFGYALFSSPNMNAIMGSVERKYLGVSSGAAGTMRIFGQLFSMGIATLVLSLFIGKQPITPAVYPELLKSIRLTFFIFSMLCLAGILASLARGNLHQGRD